MPRSGKDTFNRECRGLFLCAEIGDWCDGPIWTQSSASEHIKGWGPAFFTKDLHHKLHRIWLQVFISANIDTTGQGIHLYQVTRGRLYGHYSASSCLVSLSKSYLETEQLMQCKRQTGRQHSLLHVTVCSSYPLALDKTDFWWWRTKKWTSLKWFYLASLSLWVLAIIVWDPRHIWGHRHRPLSPDLARISSRLLRALIKHKKIDFIFQSLTCRLFIYLVSIKIAHWLHVKKCQFQSAWYLEGELCAGSGVWCMGGLESSDWDDFATFHAKFIVIK